MGIYSRIIYPKLMDKTLNKASITELRKTLLTNVEQEILEIGFGTGLNLACYPKRIQKITAIDSSELLNKKTKDRINKSSIVVDYHNINAEVLPFEDNVFASVVSTFTLCSIADVDKALSEIYRVLKPNGYFFFLEHGLSPDNVVSQLQNFANPVFKVISCNLNRHMTSIITAQGFRIIELKRFYQDDLATLFSWLYMGIAQKEM